MFPKSATLSAVLAILALAACGRRPAQAPNAPAEADPGYAQPPVVSVVSGGTAVKGTAQPGAQVRLGSPDGTAFFATADAAGAWRLDLPAPGQVRVFGVSEKAQGRQVQGQGYVLIDPTGKAALLRSGAGAIRLEPRASPNISAVDYDGDGGAVVSGTASPGAVVFLRLDGRQIAQAHADAAGRYFVAPNQPLTRGAHSFEIAGDTFTSTARADVSKAAPLVAGPLRRQLETGGLRVDWLTPGGGVQTTVLPD